MLPKNRPPTHPGEILLKELARVGLTRPGTSPMLPHRRYQQRERGAKRRVGAEARS